MGDADRWSEALGERGGLQPSPLAEGICLCPVTAACNAGLPPGRCCGAAPATACLPFHGASPCKYWVFGARWGVVQDPASAARRPRPPRIRCASRPAALPLAPALGEGGSVAEPRGAAEGPRRPATGRGFQHGRTTGWGAALPSQVESGSRDLLEVILSRWGRNWQ